MLHPIDKYCINDVTPLARRNITVAASAIILFSEEKDVKKYTKNEVVTYIIMFIQLVPTQVILLANIALQSKVIIGVTPHAMHTIIVAANAILLFSKEKDV